MATSQNGWPALSGGSSLLHRWDVPAHTGSREFTLRNGSAGFLLCHFLLWYAERIEPLAGGVFDDWGYAFREVRGSATDLSNHASGTAADANATRHPLGVVGTFLFRVKFKTKRITAAARIRIRLRLYRGAIRWGGDYNGRKDEMHFEINAGLSKCERVAKRLMDTPRGKRLLDANPGQRKVILS